MLAEGEDVKFAAKTKSVQDHIVNAMWCFFMLQCEKNCFAIYHEV